MQKITILQNFTYWHGGCNKSEYVQGQEVESPDPEMVSVAIAQGWATGGEAPKEKAERPATKARKAAPENK